MIMRNYRGRVSFHLTRPIPKGRGSMHPSEEQNKAAAELLEKRLRLLLDVKAAETGTEPSFSEIAAFLKERGTNLSRSRWTYMVNGHRKVDDADVFTGLAEFFDIDVDFLTGDSDVSTPEKVNAQLDLVRAMRAAKVKSYATRTLGDLAPETLEAITKFLEEEMTQ